MRVLGGCGLGGCRDDLPNGGNLEPNLQQFLVVENESSVEDERRLLHQLLDPVVVQSRELVPLGAYHHGMRSREGRVRVSCYGDQFVVAIGGRHDGGVGEVHLYLFLGDLRQGGKTEREREGERQREEREGEKREGERQREERGRGKDREREGGKSKGHYYYTGSVFYTKYLKMGCVLK